MSGNPIFCSMCKRELENDESDDENDSAVVCEECADTVESEADSEDEPEEGSGDESGEEEENAVCGLCNNQFDDCCCLWILASHSEADPEEKPFLILKDLIKDTLKSSKDGYAKLWKMLDEESDDEPEQTESEEDK